MTTTKEELLEALRYTSDSEVYDVEKWVEAMNRDCEGEMLFAINSKTDHELLKIYRELRNRLRALADYVKSGNYMYKGHERWERRVKCAMDMIDDVLMDFECECISNTIPELLVDLD